MASNQILIIGDIMLDRYIYGTVERISPEAPVPVLNYKNEREDLGGAGVVLDCLVKLGYKPSIITVIGDDAEGQRIIELVKKEEIETDGIIIEKGRLTTVKTRYVAISPFFQYILRLDKEKTNSITKETQEKIIRKLKEKLSKCEYVIISDYKKGLMIDKLVRETISEAKKQGKKVIVDTKGKIFDYFGADIVAPNRKELFENVDKKYSKDIEIIKKHAKELVNKMNCNVVVKLGEDGVLLSTKDKELLMPSIAKKVVNVSGAGDVFIAVMASALAEGKDLVEAVKLANKGAGIAIGKENPRVAKDELYEKSSVS
jgi:D-beta-D-heptose 7-phosphate kinase/D-beta-D-heptose 1-phosphate adenosyltransferase